MWRRPENVRCLEQPSLRLQRRLLLQFACTALPLLLTEKRALGDQEFPVTIRHAFGETTLTRRPERIVTLGWGGEDAVIALGAKPVGMTGYPFWDGRIADWNRKQLGGEKPLLMNSQLDYERIAALSPDLILSVFSGVDDLAYRRLARIAPVVTYQGKPWAADWREQAILAGRVLGKLAEAQERVRAIETDIRRMGELFSTIRDKTFALVSHFPRQNGFDVYLDGDKRVELFQQLGMKLPASVAALGRAQGRRYSTSIGLEQIDMLDCDLLIGWFSAGLENALAAQPILRTMPAIRRNTLVTLDTPAKIWSVMTPTIQSIPHGFTTLMPELAAAALRSGE